MPTNESKRSRRTRFIILGGALIAVVAVIGYFSKVWPPKGQDVAGSIGVAERYRSEQIKNEDVVLDGTDVQKFLQSDTFNHLLNDPKSRKMLSSVIGDPVVRAALSNPGVAAALANNEVRFQAFLAKTDDQPSLCDARCQAYLAKPDVQAALARPDFQALLAKSEFQVMLASPQFSAIMARPDSFQTLSNAVANASANARTDN